MVDDSNEIDLSIIQKYHPIHMIYMCLFQCFYSRNIIHIYIYILMATTMKMKTNSNIQMTQKYCLLKSD